jgi:PAS domain S-box-containing protein
VTEPRKPKRASKPGAAKAPRRADSGARERKPRPKRQKQPASAEPETAASDAHADLALFKFLSQHAVDAQILLDQDGRIDYANDAALRLFGRDSEWLRSRAWREVVDFDLARIIDRACATSAKLDEVEIHDPLRGARTAEISAKTVDFRGRRYCFVSLRDVSVRKLSERRLHVQQAVGAALATARTFDDGIERVLEELVGALGLFVAEVWFARRGELVLAAQRFGPVGDDADVWLGASTGERAEREVGLVGRAWVEQQTVWVDELESSSGARHEREARALRLRTAFALPIVDQGECVAVLSCYARAPLEADEGLLDALGAMRHGVEQFVARLRVERALWLRNRAIEATREGIVIADARVPDEPIVYVNHGFERLTRYSREEVLGRNCRFLHGPDTDPETREELREAIAARRDVRVTILNYDKRGRAFWNDLEVSPVRDESGGVTHLVGVLRDVSELKAAESDLRRANGLAQSASQAKSEFLANVSHEIRTPLSTILGFCDILLDRVQDPAVAEDVRAIRRNGAYLAELIEDILDLSRIEAGKLRIQSQSFALGDLVFDLDSLMQARALERGIALTFLFRTDVPLLLRTDRVRLRQILINLIGNALKFTEHGRVEVEIALRGDALEPQLEFSVIDSGPGIAPEDCERIFEPFTQAASTSERHRSGAGLGLTISRRLARELGGTIELASRLGEGSRFTLRLPTGPLEGTPIGRPSLRPVADSAAATAPAKGAFVGCRALVVDDVADVRRIVKHFLELGGAQVSVADSGAEALLSVERASAAREPFDVVLIDIQLPDKSGDEVVAELRARGFDRPVLAITASAMKDERSRWMRAGCDEVIAKPIDGNALSRAVAGHLARQARTRRQQAGESASSGDAVKVLVVEDDHDAAESTRRLLEARRASVRVAHSGRAALEAFREEPPDLVLLDLRLGDVDGFALLETLLAQGHQPRPHFVAVTGWSDPDTAERIQAAGFDLRLTKPVEPESLFDLLARAVRTRQ